MLKKCYLCGVKYFSLNVSSRAVSRVFQRTWHYYYSDPIINNKCTLSYSIFQKDDVHKKKVGNEGSGERRHLG